jgi:transcription elongation factor Elf1
MTLTWEDTKTHVRSVLRVLEISPNYTGAPRTCNVCDHQFLAGTVLELGDHRLMLCQDCATKYQKHIKKIDELATVDGARVSVRK